MPSAPKFLLVDSDETSRALLRWTLVRMYPGAAIGEELTRSGALDGLKQDRPDVALVHRAADADTADCVRAIRAALPTLPILVLTDADEGAAAAVRAAGATDLLRRDEWLRLRTRLDQILTPPEAR